MVNAFIREFIENLPRSMQDNIEGYVDAVAAALPDIVREASVKIEARQVDEFLVVVAIRRLWAAVNTQYWTMNDSIEVASRPRSDIAAPETSIRGFRLGRDEISANSGPFRESRLLRKELDKLLSQLEIKAFVTETVSLSEVAQRMFGAPP
jgi:hypothetical protein